MPDSMNMEASFPAAAGPGPAQPGRSAPSRGRIGATAVKWAALHDAAAAVAALAGADPTPASPAEADFAATLQAAGDWRWRLAEQGIEDLAAIMEPGLTALLACQARGANPAAAALALWQEFITARAALWRWPSPCKQRR